MQYLKADVRRPAISPDINRTEFFMMRDDVTPQMVGNKLIKKLRLIDTEDDQREQAFVTIMEPEAWFTESYGVGWLLEPDPVQGG